jgi:hypothetical protein
VPLMRRRPLMRAAMVGGAAYYGGKHVQQNRYREEGQEARIEELEAQQSAPMQAAPVMAAPPAAPPAAAAPGGMTDDTIEQLTKLGQLRDSGVLTDEEFDEQKRRLLA